MIHFSLDYPFHVWNFNFGFIPIRVSPATYIPSHHPLSLSLAIPLCLYLSVKPFLSLSANLSLSLCLLFSLSKLIYFSLITLCSSLIFSLPTPLSILVCSSLSPSTHPTLSFGSNFHRSSISVYSSVFLNSCPFQITHPSHLTHFSLFLSIHFSSTPCLSTLSLLQPHHPSLS